jgi:hypothetical protein
MITINEFFSFERPSTTPIQLITNDIEQDTQHKTSSEHNTTQHNTTQHINSTTTSHNLSLNPLLPPHQPYSLLSLPTDLLRTLTRYLTLEDISRLTQTCRFFRSHYGGPDSLLFTCFSRFRSLLNLFMYHNGLSRLGFLLDHRYSFNGKDKIEICDLRGRDRAFADILHRFTGNLVWFLSYLSFFLSFFLFFFLFFFFFFFFFFLFFFFFFFFFLFTLFIFTNT